MIDRKYVISVFVLGVLVASAVFVGVSAQQSDGAGSGSGNTIHVSASGQASAEPDESVINVAVEVTSPDPNRARETLTSRVERMRSGLDDAGIGDDEIRTTDFSIHERRDVRRPPLPEEQEETEEVTYVARHGFEIELSNIDRTGEIIDVAVSSGATQVTNVRYTLSDERRRQVRSQALQDAMENARSQANTLAGSADVSVGGVRSISTADTGVTPVRFEARDLSAGAGGTRIETGPVTVNADVSVAYEIP